MEYKKWDRRFVLVINQRTPFQKVTVTWANFKPIPPKIGNRQLTSFLDPSKEAIT
jgi:hypothetical protein